MRAAPWAAGLCWLACVAACAVTAPEVTVGSGGGAVGGGSAGGTGTGGAVDCTATSGECPTPGCLCAPAAQNFLGPVLFAVGGSPISCPAGFATQVLPEAFTHVTAPPADCNKCACGTEPCGAVDILAYGDPNCGTALAMVSPQPEVCQKSFGFPISSVLVSDSQTSALMCSHSGGGVKSRPTFTHDSATLCIGSVGASCGSGDVCVPAPRGPFALCVYAEGKAACPNGFNKSQHTVYTKTDDKRTCSGCTCGDAAPTCPTTFEAFSMNDCMTGSFGVGVAGTCFPAPPGNSGKSIKAHVTTPCARGGGDPEGEVEPSAPYTVCCR